MTLVEFDIETFDGILFSGFEAVGALTFSNFHGRVAKANTISA